MKIIALILFYLLLHPTISMSQNATQRVSETLEKKNPFLHDLLLEKFFIHTNKTVYFQGETLWFKAYVAFDINETPNYKTSNLNVNIYNSKKELILSQLVFVANGKVSGEIELPENLIKGVYFIQLETLWSKNFNKSYFSSFEILDFNKEETPEEKTLKKEIQTNNTLNIHFFPESSSLLNSTDNVIYFNTVLGNNPMAVSGKIIDITTNKTISEFQSNPEGLGKINLNYNSSSNYEAVLNDNNKTVKFKLPQAKSTGFIIHKKELPNTENNMLFSIKTNKETLDLKSGETVFVVVHRKGFVLSSIPLVLEKNYYSYNLNLLKDDLFYGVNTITIFNKSNQPVAERSFYNDKKKAIELDITKLASKNDSTTLNFKLLNKYTKVNLSVSVLPEDTKLYHNQNNILSDYLINPYLNTPLNHSAHFLNNKNNSEVLDTYIQTKTKRAFNTEEYQIHKADGYKAENGVRISGFIQAPLQNLETCKVMLTSNENNIAIAKKINKDRSFEFDSLLLKKASNFRIALIDNNGKILKAHFAINKEGIHYKPDTLIKYDIEDYYKLNTSSEKEQHQKNNIQNLEELTEVQLTGKTKKTVLVDDYPDPKVRNNSVTKTYEIIENRYQPNHTAMDVIKDLPGLLVDNNASIIRSTRGAKSIVTGSRNDQMSVILNGVRVGDFAILRNISATDITEAKINSSGAGYGLDGFAGVIILKTKFDAHVEYKKALSDINSNYTMSTAQFGFTITDSSYSNYDLIFPNSNSSNYYSTLDWLPNVTVYPNADNKITVYNEGNKDLLLVINGCNDKGDLIYKTITIKKTTD